jgi:hypothetical protein
MSSLLKTDSTSPPLSRQAFQRSSSQASSPAGESLKRVRQGGTVLDAARDRRRSGT